MTINFFQNKLRDLSEQEVEEFLRGDPVGASSAPDGLDRAMMLPYSHVLSPNDIIIGAYFNSFRTQLPALLAFSFSFDS